MNPLLSNRSKYDWLFKYKIYHIPFWVLYHCTWWWLLTGSLQEVVNGIVYAPFWVKFSFFVVFQAIAVYFNLYFLMPRYFEKGKYVIYFCLLTVTVLLAALAINFGYFVNAWVYDTTVQELFKINTTDKLHFFKSGTLPSTVASTTLAMSIKLAKNWVRDRRRQQELEKEKLETELKFLKSQFNPHFLFNTINSIFVLIKKNPDMASDSLAKFSELLRYQLYECNEHRIPLDQELSHLDNFVQLATLRLDPGRVDITYDVQRKHLGKAMIAPFVLMPFVENAFKHVSQDKDRSNWINIQLSLQDQRLTFQIANSAASAQAKDAVSYGGIGLKNVKRRLDLIYPERYDLTIDSGSKEFTVQLHIDLQSEHVSGLNPVPMLESNGVLSTVSA